MSATGAHPDDTELGCGGLLIKSARQGRNVFMCTLTRGEISYLDSNYMLHSLFCKNKS